MSCDNDIPTRGRSTEKKALLVGIGYHNGVGQDEERLGPIPTSVPNVKKFAAFLEESHGYTDITVMTDEDGVEERYRPTENNLKREIESLRRGVKLGDRRVFYFAGHSDQIICRSGSEEDGMDEVLIEANGIKINDNTLNSWLVRDLPKGSALTAIFDSCTSGTLLDLDHHRCNSVYRPWVNKGGRRSNTLRNNVVRKNCQYIPPPPLPSRPNSTYRKGSGETNVHYPGMAQQLMQPMVICEKRTMSPERQFICEGWCRTTMSRETIEHADVVSISSSNDGQISWDASTRTGDSISMTTFLIDILKKHPEITYSELMTRLNHAMHSFTRRMHDAERERHARRKADGEPGSEGSRGEMDNFQDLQLGSMSPVDMDRPFKL